MSSNKFPFTVSFEKWLVDKVDEDKREKRRSRSFIVEEIVLKHYQEETLRRSQENIHASQKVG